MRMLFRVTKGRAIMEVFDYVYENTDEDTKIENLPSKKIFVIVFQSTSENILKSKVIKICDLFGASRYQLPNRNEYNFSINQIKEEITTQEKILKEGKSSAIKFLKERSGSVSNYIK